MTDYDDTAEKEIQKMLAHKVKRLKARRAQSWSANFGMVASLGGVMIVPILLGIWGGGWLDENWPQRFSWRLSLLFVGLAWGLVNGYYWIKIEEEKIIRNEKRLADDDNGSENV